MKSTSIKTLLRALLIFIGLLSLSTQAGVEITYIHNDALGSPVAGTDEQGNVKWRSHYQPYGEEVLGERQLFGVRSGYTGHRDDPETGLTYMGARYYSPAIGRFMGVDPAGVNESNIHSFNRYAYANNNPYKYVDPDGQESRATLFKQLGMPDPGAGVANRARQIADGASDFADVGDAAAMDPTNLIPGGIAVGILKKIGGKFLANGSIEELIRGSKPGRKTKGRTTQFERQGGIDQASKDFDSLNPSNVRDIPGGRAGELDDGSKVVVRSGSKDSRPTLEIQNGKNRTKFRFND